jgi:hypothetical protein
MRKGFVLDDVLFWALATVAVVAMVLFPKYLLWVNGSRYSLPTRIDSHALTIIVSPAAIIPYPRFEHAVPIAPCHGNAGSTVETAWCTPMHWGGNKNL